MWIAPARCKFNAIAMPALMDSSHHLPIPDADALPTHRERVRSLSATMCSSRIAKQWYKLSSKLQCWRRQMRCPLGCLTFHCNHRPVLKFSMVILMSVFPTFPSRNLLVVKSPASSDSYVSFAWPQALTELEHGWHTATARKRSRYQSE